MTSKTPPRYPREKTDPGDDEDPRHGDEETRIFDSTKRPVLERATPPSGRAVPVAVGTGAKQGSRPHSPSQGPAAPARPQTPSQQPFPPQAGRTYVQPPPASVVRPQQIARPRSPSQSSTPTPGTPAPRAHAPTSNPMAQTIIPRAREPSRRPVPAPTAATPQAPVPTARPAARTMRAMVDSPTVIDSDPARLAAIAGFAGMEPTGPDLTTSPELITSPDLRADDLHPEATNPDIVRYDRADSPVIDLSATNPLAAAFNDRRDLRPASSPAEGRGGSIDGSGRTPKPVVSARSRADDLADMRSTQKMIPDATKIGIVGKPSMPRPVRQMPNLPSGPIDEPEPRRPDANVPRQVPKRLELFTPTSMIALRDPDDIDDAATPMKPMPAMGASGAPLASSRAVPDRLERFTPTSMLAVDPNTNMPAVETSPLLAQPAAKPVASPAPRAKSKTASPNSAPEKRIDPWRPAREEQLPPAARAVALGNAVLDPPTEGVQALAAAAREKSEPIQMISMKGAEAQRQRERSAPVVAPRGGSEADAGDSRFDAARPPAPRRVGIIWMILATLAIAGVVAAAMWFLLRP